jgi:hypothetical protein
MCKVLPLLSNESLLSSFKSKIRPVLYDGWGMVHSKLDVKSVLNENLGGILGFKQSLEVFQFENIVPKPKLQGLKI